MNRRFVFALLALFIIATPLRAAEEAATPAAPEADHTAQVDAARAAVTDWLKLADAGDFAGMWNAGSARFKSAVTEVKWSQMGANVRAQVGTVQTRTETSASYTTTVPMLSQSTAPTGDYVIIEFTSGFSNFPKVTEMVIAMLEDGVWRGAAYGIRPAQ